MQEIEDFPPGAVVLTPTGRRAIVKKHLAGASRKDHFSRLVCQYEGTSGKHLVTLQPQHLRRAEAGAATDKSHQISSGQERVVDTFNHGPTTAPPPTDKGQLW